MRRVLAVAVGAVLSGGLVTGAPAATGAGESASAPSKACPTQGGTRAEFLSVKNKLDVSVRITNDQIDCYDWSGTSNPSKYSGTYAAGQVLNKARLELNKGYVRRQWRITLTKANGTQLGQARLFLNWFPCGAGYEILALASPSQVDDWYGREGVVPLGTVGGRKVQMRLHTVTQAPGRGGKEGCTTASNEIILQFS